MNYVYVDTSKEPVRRCEPSLMREPRGRFGCVSSLNDEQLAEVGIRKAEVESVPEGFIPTGDWCAEWRECDAAWYWVPDCISEEQHAANVAADIEAATAAMNMELAIANEQAGYFIELLRGHLVALGHDLPCSSHAVILDIATRSATGQLTTEEQQAKDDAAALFGILSRTMSDEEIAAVWAYRQANPEVPSA